MAKKTMNKSVIAFPVHTDLQKRLKTLSLCKETLHAYTLKGNKHVHDVTVFKFCSLHGDDNGIIFKNVHF